MEEISQLSSTCVSRSLLNPGLDFREKKTYNTTRNKKCHKNYICVFADFYFYFVVKAILRHSPIYNYYLDVPTFAVFLLTDLWTGSVSSLSRMSLSWPWTCCRIFTFTLCKGTTFIFYKYKACIIFHVDRWFELTCACSRQCSTSSNFAPSPLPAVREEHVCLSSVRKKKNVKNKKVISFRLIVRFLISSHFLLNTYGHDGAYC